MHREELRGDSETGATFRHRLARLKRNGCNILLVGTGALGVACERLLGESSAGPRYRLFVTTDVRPSVAHTKLTAVQTGPYHDSATVLNWNADVRGDVTSGDDQRRSVDDDHPFRERVVEGDALEDLAVAIEDAIATFDADSDGLSPAELRVCFDSMTLLVTEYDHEDVRRFLLDVTEAVEAVDGMAHYHLPAEYDSGTVETLEPLFDAVVEVRRIDGDVQQRWHLPDADITTDWLLL